MDRKSTIGKHQTWTEKVTYTNTKHVQKTYHTVHKHQTWTEKIRYTNSEHGQKNYDTQTRNMDRKSTKHKH